MRFYHSAQMNIARAVALGHSPLLTDLLAQIEGISRLTAQSPSFIW